MLIKLDDLLISREKSYFGTECGEKFPVKIAFSRPLDENELIKLAAYALAIEKGYEFKEGE